MTTFCNAVHQWGQYCCELAKGHDGYHRAERNEGGYLIWADPTPRDGNAGTWAHVRELPQ